MEKVDIGHKHEILPLQRPPRPTHFIGREEEITQLLTILQSGRVVMLYGPEGVGKSTLVAELLWRLASDDSPPQAFPDGFIYHNFYAQPQTDLVFEKFVHAFRQKAHSTPVAAAQRVLSKRNVLLVLDGAEAADDLNAILAVRGQCGVLISSRQYGNTADGRRVISLMPVEEAVNLLKAWGGRQATDEVAMHRICELIGGLPLAIRLAGSYMVARQESAVDFLAWLEETSLSALDQSERLQKSVPLLLARNVAGLSEPARQILGLVSRLAPTPFGPEIIVVALEISRDEAISLLEELVSYGLLMQAEKRYWISHDMVHTYAWRQIFTPGDMIQWVAAYFSVLAAEQSKLGGEGYARLDEEREHIMAILTACNEQKVWQAAQKLAQAVDSYLNIQGYWTERMTAIQIGLTASRQLEDRRCQGIFLSALGSAFHNLGQIGPAKDYYKQALTIHQEVGNQQSEGTTAGDLGLVYYSWGQMDRAISCYKQAVTIAQKVGNQQKEESWLGNLGLAYYSTGQAEQAIECYEQALTIAQNMDDRRKEGNRLGNLGLVYYSLGQTERAIEYYEQALTIARESGDQSAEANWLDSLGTVIRDMGQVVQAIEHHEKALSLARQIGDQRIESTVLDSLGNVYYDMSLMRRAIDYFEEALMVAQQIDDQQATITVLGSLGNLYHDLNQAESAIAYYRQALAIAQDIGNQREIGNWLNSLGDASRDLKELAQAIDYYQQALAAYREINDHQGEGTTLGNLGNAYHIFGQIERAVEHYEQALTIAREIGDQFNEGAWLSNLGLAYRDVGQVAQARLHLQQAYMIFKETNSPFAEEIDLMLTEIE